MGPSFDGGLECCDNGLTRVQTQKLIPGGPLAKKELLWAIWSPRLSVQGTM